MQREERTYGKGAYVDKQLLDAYGGRHFGDCPYFQFAHNKIINKTIRIRKIKNEASPLPLLAAWEPRCLIQPGI